MPITNSLTFVFTVLAGTLLGESIENKGMLKYCGLECVLVFLMILLLVSNDIFAVSIAFMTICNNSLICDVLSLLKNSYINMFNNSIINTS